jgi:hypothetical protein
MKRSQLLDVALALAAFLLIASPAQAYLDPGTGSMLVSAVIGVIAAMGLALKMFWYRLVGWARGKRRGSDSNTAGGPPVAHG